MCGCVCVSSICYSLQDLDSGQMILGQGSISIELSSELIVALRALKRLSQLSRICEIFEGGDKGRVRNSVWRFALMTPQFA